MSTKKNLTAREKEILQLIFSGYTDPNIAEELAISDKTASTHRKHMLRKLAVKNTASLIRYAMEKKLVK
ncbi:MAG: LuxR C-terminal-related transcriptional regulator [Panacibacter sp.]